MEKRKKTQSFLISVAIGVCVFTALAIFLALTKSKAKVQIVGTTDSLGIELDGGLEMHLVNVNDIALIGRELQIDSVRACSVRVLNRFVDTAFIIQSSNKDVFEGAPFRIIPPRSCYTNFNRLGYIPVGETSYFLKEMGWFYIHGDIDVRNNKIPLSIGVQKLGPPSSFGTILVVLGNCSPKDTLLLEVTCPTGYVEIGSSWFHPVDTSINWELWFPNDSEATYQGFRFHDSPRIFPFISSSKSGHIRIIPHTVDENTSMSNLHKASFGVIIRYGEEHTQENEIVSKGKSIKLLATRIGNDSDSMILRIDSPLRPTPYYLTFGDEIEMKGNFTLSVMAKVETMEVNLSGIAKSIKYNGRHILPSILEVWSKTLLALAAITGGLVVLIYLLYNFFIKWPSEQRSPKPKRKKSTK